RPIRAAERVAAGAGKVVAPTVGALVHAQELLPRAIAVAVLASELVLEGGVAELEQALDRDISGVDRLLEHEDVLAVLPALEGLEVFLGPLELVELHRLGDSLGQRRSRER